MNPISKKQALFDRFAEEFSATRTHVWPELTFFRDALFPGARVLDLGCGNGKNMAFFEAADSEAIGLDISEKLLHIARENHPSKSFVTGDMRKLPFRTGKFDAVFAIASLHHLRSRSDRKKTLAGAFRVLKAGGNLCGTVWNMHQKQFAESKKQAAERARLLPWWKENDYLIPWGDRKIPRYYHAFSPDEMAELLTEAGFINVELFGVQGDAKVAPLDGRNICFRARKPRRIHILDVPFDMPSYKTALRALHEYSAKPGQAFVTTPNPEICVAAARNPSYLNILRKADSSLPDGIGILWAGEYLAAKSASLLLSIFRFALTKRSRFFPARVCGSDIFRDFCASSKEPIFLLGGAPGVAKKCAEYFKAKGADIVGTDSGKATLDDDARIIQKIDASGAGVLFVAFGAPKQEEWIDRNLQKLPHIRLAMGIGGSFDFVVGKQKRAPSVFRKMGLEWVWRLVKEPSRRYRIITAVWVFPRLVRKEKIQKATSPKVL